jgi:hypothetical protein
MVEITCRTDRRKGVTLVEAVARNDGDVTRRVRLEHALDGSVWPPRRRGVPVDDWNDDAVERTLSPGERTGVGFASPAPPESPPVRVAESRRVGEAVERRGDRGEEAAGSDAVDASEVSAAGDAADVLRELGDPSPPRDAVPPPDDLGEPPEAAAEGTTDRDAEEANEAREEGLPAPVAEWFAAVEARVETVEDCAAATSLPEATDAVGDAGDLAAVESALDRLPADAAALRAAGRRAESLADRADAVDGEVPAAALRTLS